MIPKIPPREVDLLTCLLEHGPHIAYQIADRSGVRRSTTYANLSRLEQKVMVESRKLQAENKTKGEREYTLTLYGFAVALLRNEAEWASLDQIIKHWQYLLPSVLSKWGLFREGDVESAARTRLLDAAGAFCSEHSQMLEHASAVSGKRLRGVLWLTTDGESETDRFTRYFYDVRVWTSDRYRWASVCKSDREIARLISAQLSNLEKEHRELVRIYGN